MLQSFGKRSRAQQSDSESSDESEDEQGAGCMTNLGMTQTQLQWLGYVRHMGTREQYDVLKNPERAFKTEARRQVQTERKNLEAAFAYLYEQWKPRVDELLNLWETHKIRQVEAELTANRLVLLAKAMSHTEVSARQKIGWQVDTQRNIVMQREVEIRTIIEELTKMKQAMTLTKAENQTFEFAEIFMEGWRSKQRAYLNEDPDAQRQLEATRKKFAKKQAQDKDKHVIDTLVAIQAGRSEHRPHGKEFQGKEARQEKKKRATEEDPDRFPPIGIERGETLHDSLKGFYVPKLSAARPGYKGKYLLSKPATEGFRYRCGLCLKDNHHFMQCGASELKLPGVVTRPDGTNRIVTFRELFKKGIVDAEGKII